MDIMSRHAFVTPTIVALTFACIHHAHRASSLTEMRLPLKLPLSSGFTRRTHAVRARDASSAKRTSVLGRQHARAAAGRQLRQIPAVHLELVPGYAAMLPFNVLSPCGAKSTPNPLPAS
jgi:hypothetical protein